MKHLHLNLALAALALAPAFAKADPITYTFNQTYTQAANNSFTVTGTLTTDGVIGQVTAADITGYDLSVSQTTRIGAGSAELNSLNSELSYLGGISATASDLSFEFIGNDLLDIQSYAKLDFAPGGANFLGLGKGATFVSETGTQVIASVASAATPEPSSLLLLGTGALALAGAARRRFTRA